MAGHPYCPSRAPCEPPCARGSPLGTWRRVLSRLRRLQRQGGRVLGTMGWNWACGPPWLPR
eukprot:6126744-Pyramimonas_sp.AAC.1